MNIPTVFACVMLAASVSSFANEGDPPLRDAAYPPTVVEFSIASGDAAMNGHAYVAMGVGPHPTVVLVHGYPGNEKNLDLAQALRRAGINTVFFHPRGAWGSTGYWSVTNSLEDIQAVIDFVKSDFAQQNLRSDPARIGLLGHSLGGFLTLMFFSQSDDLNCAVSMAGTNLGGNVERAEANKAASAVARKGLSQRPEPQVWAPGYTLYDEALKHGDDWNLLNYTTALASKPLLLVAGTKDTVVAPELNHAPLVEAISSIDGNRLQTLELEAAHSFSSKRLALARSVTAFFKTSCSF